MDRPQNQTKADKALVDEALEQMSVREAREYPRIGDRVEDEDEEEYVESEGETEVFARLSVAKREQVRCSTGELRE